MGVPLKPYPFVSSNLGNGSHQIYLLVYSPADYSLVFFSGLVLLGKNKGNWRVFTIIYEFPENFVLNQCNDINV